MNVATGHRWRGMTLIELMVVLVIMGLLTVTAVPLLVGNRDKKSVRDAADAAASVFSHVATKAMTSSNGAAAWLETGTTGAGAAVTSIAFARVPAVATGSTTIATSNATTVTVSLRLGGSFVDDLPAPIEFAGIPGVFTATGTSSVTCATTSVSGSMNRTYWNSAPPQATATMVPYTIHLPPRPSSFASATLLRGDVAIDLSASQIGLNSSATSLSGYSRVAIEYDRTGSPISAWMSTAASGGNWTRKVLSEATPIILAIGMQSQAGQNWVSEPSEDNPGASWQSPFARWLLIDPRNGSARVIEAGSCKGAQDETTARSLSLAPVVEEFKNSRTGG